MMEFVKKVAGVALTSLVEFAQTKLLDNKPGLYTPKDNPELIEAVTKQLQGQDAHMILSKLLDFEKAIYHLAGRQQEMILQQKELEKAVVSTATTVEEMSHSIDGAINAEMAESAEEDFLVDAWDVSKKSAVSSN